MSYQPFTRADRKRWRRGEKPRAVLRVYEWCSAHFGAWSQANPSPAWRRISKGDVTVAAFVGPMLWRRV